MQGLLSVQAVGVPGAHRPTVHVSPVVQALPSLQSPSRFVWVQPLAKSQASAVQLLPSSHADAVPAVHAPAAHVSPAVQTLPSSHVAALGRCAQPIAGSQESSVHTLPSLQSTAPWTAHAPLLHFVAVQALPSSQTSLLLVCTQPTLRSHLSSVHGFWSSQSAFTVQPIFVSGAVVSPSAASGWVASVSKLSFASTVSGASAVSLASLLSGDSFVSAVSPLPIVSWVSTALSPTCTSS